MKESKEIRTMRIIEWEKVKGSIQAILASYWSCGEKVHNNLEVIVNEFIDHFGTVGGFD